MGKEPFLYKTYRTNVQFGGTIDNIKVDFDVTNKVGIIIAKTPEEVSAVENHPLFQKKLIWEFRPLRAEKIINPFDAIFSPQELYGISLLSADKKSMIRTNVLGILGIETQGTPIENTAAIDSIDNVILNDSDSVISDTTKQELLAEEQTAKLSGASDDLLQKETDSITDVINEANEIKPKPTANKKAAATGRKR